MNQEKTAEAVRLYTQGCSLDSIAVELGIHESTVRSALLRAGVRMRRRGAPGVPLSRLVALRTSGLTYDEIGRAVGLTKCSVWARLRDRDRAFDSWLNDGWPLPTKFRG